MNGFLYTEYDGLGLADLVKKREIHPRELVEVAISRIETLNPKLNAIINKMYDQARKTAEKELSGTFAGVPVLLKDIGQEVEGEPITSGSKALRGYRAGRDSVYVSILRSAGVLFLGQTNVPEFGLMGITEPAFYGPTKNPWNLNHTPGGSSGGSASAVASGMVPVAGASDGGGSIRIPASYCGLFGLKPTRGRTPVGPRHGRLWQGAAVQHVLTRTVRDSAAMLDELAVFEKAAAFYAPPFEGNYSQMARIQPGKQLRIAFSGKSPMETEVHPECREALMKTVKILDSMGHIVEEKDAPVDGNKIAKSYFSMYFGEVAATLAELEGVLGRKVKQSDVEPTTWILGLLGKACTACEFVLSIKEWDNAAYLMEQFHEVYDFYITPTVAFPPAKIGELEPGPVLKLLTKAAGKLGTGGLLKKSGIVEQIARKSLIRTPFTQLANFTGQPAMTVPLHQTADGLPIGVQFMAARGRENLLFQIAGLLEQSEYWVDVRKNPLFYASV